MNPKIVHKLYYPRCLYTLERQVLIYQNSVMFFYPIIYEKCPETTQSIEWRPPKIQTNKLKQNKLDDIHYIKSCSDKAT